MRHFLLGFERTTHAALLPCFRFIPPGVLPDARLLLWARGLRAFGDGYVSLLLPYYLTLLGYSALEIGAIVTATLLGSGLMTLGVGFIAHRFRQRTCSKSPRG